VIVGAFVVAAIVTPPDVMSQLLLAIPLCLLYELGLLVAPLFVKKDASV
jgi:sec-independent protein translocase protein TatC